MPAITVYTQPNCQPCKAVKRWLDRRGITYKAVDVSQSPDAMAAIRLVVDYMTKYITKRAA